MSKYLDKVGLTHLVSLLRRTFSKDSMGMVPATQAEETDAVSQVLYGDGTWKELPEQFEPVVVQATITPYSGSVVGIQSFETSLAKAGMGLIAYSIPGGVQTTEWKIKIADGNIYFSGAASGASTALLVLGKMDGVTAETEFVIPAPMSVMKGATSSSSGQSGTVPQPKYGDQDKVLTGGGVWKAISQPFIVSYPVKKTEPPPPSDDDIIIIDPTDGNLVWSATENTVIIGHIIPPGVQAGDWSVSISTPQYGTGMNFNLDGDVAKDSTVYFICQDVEGNQKHSYKIPYLGDLAAIRSGAALGATALQSYTETDPTVPSWAKQPDKPTYTAAEVGAQTPLTADTDYLTPGTASSTYQPIGDYLTDADLPGVFKVAFPSPVGEAGLVPPPPISEYGNPYYLTSNATWEKIPFKYPFVVEAYASTTRGIMIIADEHAPQHAYIVAHYIPDGVQGSKWTATYKDGGITATGDVAANGNVYFICQETDSTDTVDYTIPYLGNYLTSHQDISGKQDVISDLATIRDGAAKGATALQSFTESDPTVPAWAKAENPPVPNTFAGSAPGLVPEANAAHSLMFLRGDGQWAEAGGGSSDGQDDQAVVTVVFDVTADGLASRTITTGTNIEKVNDRLVVMSSDIPDGVQGSEWTVRTGSGQLSLDGTILQAGTVSITLCSTAANATGADGRLMFQTKTNNYGPYSVTKTGTWYQWLQVPAIEGYTPIGIIGWQMTNNDANAYISNLCVEVMNVNGNTQLYNPTASTINFNLSRTVLYIRSDLR